MPNHLLVTLFCGCSLTLRLSFKCAARHGPPRTAPAANEVKEAQTVGVKRAKEAVRRLQGAGIIDAKGRRIRHDERQNTIAAST